MLVNQLIWTNVFQDAGITLGEIVHENLINGLNEKIKEALADDMFLEMDLREFEEKISAEIPYRWRLKQNSDKSHWFIVTGLDTGTEPVSCGVSLSKAVIDYLHREHLYNIAVFESTTDTAGKEIGQDSIFSKVMTFFKRWNNTKELQRR